MICTPTWRSRGLEFCEAVRGLKFCEAVLSSSLHDHLVLRLSVESAQGAVAVQRANDMQEQYDQLHRTQQVCRTEIRLQFPYHEEADATFHDRSRVVSKKRKHIGHCIVA